MKHKNVLLHFIVLPMINQIILEKEKSGEPLTDLEFMSWGLWRGVDDMKYLKQMMNRKNNDGYGKQIKQFIQRSAGNDLCRLIVYQLLLLIKKYEKYY